MDSLLKIDGRAFHVGVESIRRKSEIRDGKNSGTSLLGTKIRDIKGTFYSYELIISALNTEPVEYDELYRLVSAPVEFRSITVPYGQSDVTFNAYVSCVDDEVVLIDGVTLWGNMKITFESTEPNQMP